MVLPLKRRLHLLTQGGRAKLKTTQNTPSQRGQKGGRMLELGISQQAVNKIKQKAIHQVLKRDEGRRARQKFLWAMCGPAALHWLLRAHSPDLPLPSIDQIAKMAKTDESGTSLFNLKEAAKRLGFRTSALKVTFDGLKQIRLPALLLLEGHYVVLRKVRREGIWVVNPIPPFVLGARGKAVEKWQFVDTFLPKERLGEGWKGAVLVVLGRY